MSTNIHLERIGDTEANCRANLDLLQLAILTNLGEELVYMNDDASKMYYVARQKYWNGAALTYCNAEFQDLYAYGGLYAAEYIYHNGDTDTNMKWFDDGVTFSAGGVLMLTMGEDTQDAIIFNEGGGDVDWTIHSATVNNALWVSGDTGYVGIWTAAPDTILHVWGGSAGDVTPWAGTKVTIEDAISAFISILTPDANSGGLIVGDPADNNSGCLIYDNNSHVWGITAGGADSVGVWGTTGLTIKEGLDIRAGGGAGLRLEDDGGNGVLIADGGDLQLDANKYLQLGHAMNMSDDYTISIKHDTVGAVCNMWVPVKDSGGNVLYVPATTEAP